MSDPEKILAAVEKLARLVEPEADIPRQTMTDCMLASIAISLKRLADAVCGDEKNTGIHRAIIDMADTIAN